MSTEQSSFGTHLAGQPPSMDEIKSAMRGTWMSGDFGKIAAGIAHWAEDFVKHAAPQSGARVLDVACGTGNVTLPLARLGAAATGVDIAPNLLEQARERADAEHLHITFDEGDAESLPYPDGSFDMVFSMFGAIFAPRPELVVKEFARVLRPGGTLTMANWTPESFSGSMFRVTSRHVPPPPGIPSSLLWGEKEAVHARLRNEFANIHTEVVPIQWDLPVSPAEASALFRRYFGPTVTAMSRLDAKKQAELGSDLDSLWSGACVSRTPATHTVVNNEYLRVTATRIQ